MAERPAFRLRRISVGVALCTGAASMVLVPSIPALANPSGATVVHGAAAFAQDGALLQIDNSPGAIIDWTSFSIAQDEITRFQQQSAASAVLNRVTSGEISAIHGQLVSNGQVFLINPNGMVFGQNATIDTAGFVASTLDMANEDFLAGAYRFAGDSGSIINEGYLTTRSGNVFFIAPDIENAGIIHAESGALVLAAGRSIRIGSLDNPDIQFEITAPDDEIINLGQLLADQGSIHAFAGTLTHSGGISASGVALAEDGSIILHAEGDNDLQAGSSISASGAAGGDILVQSETGTVFSAGAIAADGNDGDGGRIRLLGNQVGLFGEARVHANGTGSGGEILIGGNITGLGPEPNATAVFIGTGTEVSASSTDAGNGGTIIAYADELNRTYGTLTARGGPNGGDGGFIETSADFIEVTRTPDAGASNGTAGQWLIDPDLLVIGADGLVEVIETNLQGATEFSADPQGVAPTIQDTLIEAAIDGGTSVIVRTNGIEDSIRVQEPLDFNATTPGLFLRFDTGFDINSNIFVEAPIVNTGAEALDYEFSSEGFVDFGADVDTGGLGLIDVPGQSFYGGAAVFSADVTLNGNVSVGTMDIDGVAATVDGDLTASTLDSDGRLQISGATLDVSGISDLDQLLVSTGSTVSFGGETFVTFSTDITDSSVTFGGGAFFVDDVSIAGSVVDFEDTINAPFVDINESSMFIGGASSLIGDLFLISSDLELDNGVFVDVATLELAGNIGGNGQLSVLEGMGWAGGTVGAVGASTRLIVQSEALLDISGTADKFLRGDALLENLGTVEFNSGDIVLGETARFLNAGTLNANLIDGDQSLLRFDTDSTAQFVNDVGATLNRSGNGSALSLDVDVIMDGTVNLLEGELRFLNRSQQTASYATAAGTTVDFAGGVGFGHFLSEGIEFVGDGLVQVGPAVVRVFATPLTVSNFRFDGGTITGSGDLVVTDSMEWTGGIFGSSTFGGNLVIDPTATLTLSSAGNKRIAANWRMQNLGTVDWNAGTIQFTDNGRIDNVGTFNTFTAGPKEMLAFGTNVFENTGQINIGADVGSVNLDVPVNNMGSIQVDNGLTRLAAGSTTGEGGNWNIGSVVGVLRLEDAFNLAVSGTSFAGPGVLQIETGAQLITSGSIDVENLFLNGGVVSGGGSTLIGDSFAWSSGAIAGGPLILASGGEAVFSTSGSKQLIGSSLELLPGSSTLWDGGEIQLSNESLLALSGNLSIRSDTNIIAPEGEGFVENLGSITKELSDGTTRFLVPFDNNGSMTALRGTISLERDGTHNGDFFVQPPGDIVFPAGNHILNGEFVNLGDQVFTEATMTIDGPFVAGNVIIQDFSNITFNGTYTADSTSILNNSVAEFLFAASTNDLTMSGGSDIQGPGTLTISGNAMIDQLLLTRVGDTVFSGTSTLMASDIDVSGPGTLSLNGTATLGDLAIADGRVSVGGDLTTASLLINGGDFTGPGTTQITGDLLLDNGVLTGAGDVSVEGVFNWFDGVVSGTGALDIAPGGSISAIPGASLTMQDRTLRNRSDVGIDFVDVQLALNGAAVLDNQGRMRIETLPGEPLAFLSGTGTVLNSGEFEAIGAPPEQGGGFAGEIRIDNRFDNSGTVTVSSGSLQLYGGGTHSGSFLMTPLDSFFSAGRLRLRGTHTLDAASTLAGATLAVESGSSTIDGTVDLDTLLVSTGAEPAPGQVILNSDADLQVLGLFDGDPLDASVPTLGGTGAISVSDELIWEGGTIDGSSLLALADTVQTSRFGLADSRPADTPLPLLTLSGRTFSSAIPDALLERGRLQILGGGVFENSGGFTFGSEGGAPFTVEGGTNGTFRNSGTVTGASDLVFGTTTLNAGTVQAPNLALAAGVTLTQDAGSIAMPGTFDVAGDLVLLGGSLAAATTSVTGSLGGVGTITGDLNNAGTLGPGTSPGTLAIAGNFTQDALGTLILEVDGTATEPGVDFDLLAISGSASFDGTLELIALDGFSGTFGAGFQPITYASATGGFARVVQPNENIQFTPVFGPNGLTAEVSAALNPDGTANIDTDNPPIPDDQEQAELFADAVAGARGTTQEDIEATDTTVVLDKEQELVQDECAERLDRPDGETGDDGTQGVGCRSL